MKIIQNVEDHTSNIFAKFYFIRSSDFRGKRLKYEKLADPDNDVSHGHKVIRIIPHMDMKWKVK